MILGEIVEFFKIAFRDTDSLFIEVTINNGQYVHSLWITSFKFYCTLALTKKNNASNLSVKVIT